MQIYIILKYTLQSVKDRDSILVKLFVGGPVEVPQAAAQHITAVDDSRLPFDLSECHHGTNVSLRSCQLQPVHCG